MVADRERKALEARRWSERQKQAELARKIEVQKRAEEEAQKQLELLNPFNPKEFKEDKLSIVDVRAKNEEGEWFIIEIQVLMTDYYPKRILYYWARTYQGQLTAGTGYDELKKTTVISISKSELPIRTKSYANHFRLVSAEDKETRFCDDLSIYTIELSKFMVKEEDVQKSIEKWTYFLKNGEDLDDKHLPKCLEGKEMSEAITELKKMSMDEKERAVYEARRMALVDAMTRESYSFTKGEDIGIKKGEEIGIKKGKIEGKIEGIEASLEIKFGANGLSLMDEVRKISDMEKLTQFQQRIKTAQTVEELRQELG